jgi:hypothetical protein
MADETGLNVPIRSTFDSKGTDDAAAGMKKTEAAAKSLQDQAKTAAEEGVKKLSEALAEMATLGELVSFLKDSTEEFYNMEKALRGVSVAASGYGLDVKKTTKEVDEWAEAMSHASGVADDQLARAVGEQLTLTGSLEQAYSRVGLAQDYATANGVSFARGMEVVSAAVLGKTRALVGVIPGITRQTEATEASSKAIAFLEGKVRGATLAIDDNAKAADRARASWAIFKEQIGSQVAPVITGLRQGFMLFIETIELGVGKIGAAIIRAGEHFANFAGLIKGLYTKSAAQAWNDFRTAQTEADKTYIATLNALEEQTAERMMKRDAASADAFNKATNEKIKSELKFADTSVRITDTLDKQLEARWRQNTLNYIKNQNFMQEEGRKGAAEAILNMAKEDAIRQEYHRKALAYAEEYQRKKKELAKQEIEMQAMVANGVIAIGEEVFGQSKEFAIAHAIINTYQGAALALATYPMPYGAIMAALTVALGIAQVAKIQSTEPTTTKGAGFDDPSNDAAARQGGRRWANDMIREFTTGVSAGWAEGMRGGGSTVNNVDNSRRTTINASIQDPSNIESVKKLIRTIKLVDSNVLGQTTIASRTK